MIRITKMAAICLPACAMLALAQPAQALDGTINAAAKGAAASAEKAQAKPAASKKYCLKVVQDTGTRIARESCRTKAEWAEQDIEVPSER